jgi:hypothetical protein
MVLASFEKWTGQSRRSISMDRREREFLSGFERAAILTRRILESPPSHTTARQYMEDVAHLMGDSDDLLRRGLAVGCLSALGKE